LSRLGKGDKSLFLFYFLKINSKALKNNTKSIYKPEILDIKYYRLDKTCWKLFIIYYLLKLDENIKSVIIIVLVFGLLFIPVNAFAQEFREIYNPTYTFRLLVDDENFLPEKGYYTSVKLLPRSDYVELYEFLKGGDNTVVVYPQFTQTAYSKGGFYDYYNKICDQKCLEVSLQEIDNGDYRTSDTAYQAFKILNYQIISDLDVHKNPDILKKYDKVIVLHNEYVTRNIFDALNNHHNVLYLYPNALYAEIEYDEESNSIKLIRGHNYPPGISNGFDWEFENTHPFEFDTKCENWEFYEIDNGMMLNCYPESLMFENPFIFMAIKFSDDKFWWNLSQKIDSLNDTERLKMMPILEKLKWDSSLLEIQGNSPLQQDVVYTDPDEKGGGCLIATATYGSELALQVQQLRELRDNSLLQTESGTSFMKHFNDFYYSFSPIIADYERENLVFREMVKVVITPMISSFSILNYVDMDSEESVIGYGISLILLNIGMYVGIPAVAIIGIRKKL